VTRGVVKFFKSEKGWGAISSDEFAPDRDAWVHYSAIEGDGPRDLAAGDAVDFEYEEINGHNWTYRVTRVRRLPSVK
jgi:cold shock protein